MTSLNAAEQAILFLSIFAGVFSVSAVAFTWWISRPAPPADQDEPHRTPAE
jgi:hypothetical protein